MQMNGQQAGGEMKEGLNGDKEITEETVHKDMRRMNE